MHVPSHLEHLRAEPAGDAWLDALPGLVNELVTEWQLVVGEPYPTSHVSWTAPAVRDGEPVVLKVQWPHRECEHEARALSAWAGDGAVRLLDHDPERHALLLERCDPGTPLSADPDADAVGALIDLLPHLWVPAGPPFRVLADEAAGWAARLEGRWEAAGRPCERPLVDAAARYLTDLPPTQGPAVLIHQDLHGDNVLAAQREPWLAIDPKPLAGEREMAVAPIVRSFELGHSPAAARARLDRCCAELGLDRERALGWTVAQTMAWSFGSGYWATHHDTVRWLLAG
ncbi:MAG TPA: aminoglycoside phosphotransferase family protein [Acidimicrobiales bacterium]|nr:aminoglycoside phosphotransferase family protein [Acidimicrobiales bacterium]